VESVQAKLAARPVQTVWPLRVIALLSTTLGVLAAGVVQVQLPAGTATVSPDEAELMAVRTSLCEQLAAVIVAA